jgi:hypothetical protein
MPPAGFGPTILVSERPQTHGLDRAATGIGIFVLTQSYYIKTLETFTCFDSCGIIIREFIHQVTLYKTITNININLWIIIVYYIIITVWDPTQ